LDAALKTPFGETISDEPSTGPPLSLIWNMLNSLPSAITATLAHRELIGRSHNDARGTGTDLDDLAGPFGIEQVGEAVGRIGNIREPAQRKLQMQPVEIPARSLAGAGLGR
jgi:hypothetical protein